MKSIKQLSDILPIRYDDKILRLLSFHDIEWYSNNLRRDYYERYMDFKFSKDIAKERLEQILYQIAIDGLCGTASNHEARLVLCNEESIIGGITIMEKDDASIELGYFIIPEQSSKGLASKMLSVFIDKLRESKVDFKIIRLIIREDNAASIKVAEKLGFKLSNEVLGKYKRNLIYTLVRD